MLNFIVLPTICASLAKSVGILNSIQLFFSYRSLRNFTFDVRWYVTFDFLFFFRIQFSFYNTVTKVPPEKTTPRYGNSLAGLPVIIFNEHRF